MIDKTNFVKNSHIYTTKSEKAKKANTRPKTLLNRSEDNANPKDVEQQIIQVLEKRFGSALTQETDFLQLVAFIKQRVKNDS